MICDAQNRVGLEFWSPGWKLYVWLFLFFSSIVILVSLHLPFSHLTPWLWSLRSFSHLFLLPPPPVTHILKLILFLLLPPCHHPSLFLSLPSICSLVLDWCLQVSCCHFGQVTALHQTWKINIHTLNKQYDFRHTAQTQLHTQKFNNLSANTHTYTQRQTHG